MNFFKSFFMKVLSLLIILVVISNTTQAQPNLYFSLKDFFGKINSIIYPINFFRKQSSSFSSGQYATNDSSIGVRRNPFYISPKTSNLENIKIQSTHPDIAYDPDNQRYLVVWENRNDNGSSSILGQFRDKNGNSLNYPVLISTPRTKRGCFYENFDSDNGAITTPKNCPNASNPAVSYNKGSDGKGRFLVVWELKGLADFAKNSDGSSNSEGRKFSNIIAKMLNANDLTPAAHPDDKGSGGTGTDYVWEEGILISGIWIVSNNPAHPATNDSEVQAWEQSAKPEVAPSSSNGFLVTWQTNKGFIGCDDPMRRDSSSIYARYIQPEFSPTNRTLNKSSFPVYTDPTAALKPSDTGACFVLPNVFRAQKPRIAYNSTNKGSGSSDFVIAYEFARAASASRGDIGMQKVSLNSSNDGAVINPTFTEYVVKGGDGVFLENPDVISYLDHAVLAYDDQHNISLKSVSLDLKELASVNLGLGGNEGKTEPRLSGGFGVSGNAVAGAADTITLSFINQNNFSAVLLDGMLNLLKGPVNISTTAQSSRLAEIATDFSNFVVTWAGTNNGVETVQAYKFLSSPKNNSPLTPELSASPANGVTWAPTRLYLHWNAANDPDGDKLVYEVYFSEVSSDPKVFPQPSSYKSDVIDTKFIIQSSTDGRPEFFPNMGVSPIYLQANKSYAWKICAKDSKGVLSICSEPRRFNTDDSVVGWWKFDEGKGTTTLDSSGLGNNGILKNGTTWTNGVVGNALQFDGVDDLVEVLKPSFINNTNGTMIAWINTKSVTGGNIVGAYAENSYDWISMTTNAMGKTGIYNYMTPSRLLATSDKIINDGSWHFITYNQAIGKHELFVDGISQILNYIDGSSSDNWWFNGHSNPLVKFLMGARQTPISVDNFFSGQMDEVAVFSHALLKEDLLNIQCGVYVLANMPLKSDCMP